MNYNEAVEYIYQLRKFGREPGKIRAARALDKLGRPEKSLKIIHVAGTNGKGSVCAFLTGLLRGRGFCVGMFTSPHLVKVNERIQLDGVMISDEEFMEYFERVYRVSCELVQEGHDGLAFFDFVFVMAMLYYADQKPDYVVMETGLGGRSDATAAVSCKILSIITSISLDHTEILGDTLEKIAWEKAGIIGSQSPVVYWKTNEEVAGIFEQEAGKCNSKGYSVDEKSYKILEIGRKKIDFSIENEYYRNNVFTISFAGIYQVMNASLALTAMSILARSQGLPENASCDVSSICNTRWAGRMEEIETQVYLDGAHNPDGIARLIETAKYIKEDLTKEQPEGHLYLLFGAVCEKDYEQMIQELCHAECFDGYVITKIQNHRALDTAVMENVFRKHTTCSVVVDADNRRAYQKAKALLGEKDVLLCAGSLYLVGAIKEMMGESI